MLEKIIQTVADNTEINILDIKSGKRSKEIVFARHLSMWACKNTSEAPLSIIAEEHCCKQHGSVIHAISSINHQIKYNSKIKLLSNKILKQLSV